MQTNQCPSCARYRGALTCDRYPEAIPEAILTGERADEEGYLPIAKLAKGFEDFTQPIADRDEALYERVKKVLCALGYQESDFLEGGLLEGLSTNQLLELAHEARDAR